MLLVVVRADDSRRRRSVSVVHGGEVGVGGGAGVAQHPVDGRHAGDGEGVAHSLRQQRFANLPGEEAGVFLFESQDSLDDRGCGDLLQNEKRKIMSITRKSSHRLSGPIWPRATHQIGPQFIGYAHYTKAAFFLAPAAHSDTRK